MPLRAWPCGDHGWVRLPLLRPVDSEQYNHFSGMTLLHVILFFGLALLAGIFIACRLVQGIMRLSSRSILVLSRDAILPLKVVRFK